jgi:hypothetical protein
MGWNRKSHFYCEVESSRAHTERICANAKDGLMITAAGYKGAIKLHIFENSISGDRFEIEFIPWLKSEKKGPPVTIARGRLDYDAHADGQTVVRLDAKLVEAFTYVRAKEIMMEGIPHTTD